jgi:hypothetical protein
MLRKLVSGLIVFTLATFGLSQASPASSASFGPTVVGASGNLSFTIPLDEGKAMVVWQDGSSSPNTLKSSLLNADGSVTGQATIYQPPADFYYSLSSYSSWAKMRDGSIALTWTIENRSAGISEVLVGYSDNGTEWSLPQVVSSGEYDANSMDCMFRCGFSDAHIASDGLGRIALQVVSSTSRQAATRVLQYFSTDGVSWSPPSYPTVNFDSIYAGNIMGLPLGGFVASWAGWKDNNAHRFANRTVGKTSAWTVPQLLSTTYQVDGSDSIFLVTAPDEITYLFVSSPNETDRYAIVARRLSLKTMVWAPEQTIFVTGTAGWLNGSIRADVGPDGTVAVGVASALDGQPVSYLHFNTFKGTQIGTKTVPVTFDEQGSALTAVFANPNGSHSLIYHSGNGPSKLLTLAANQQAETTTLEFGSGQTWESSAVRSIHGNIFMASDMQGVVKALSIVRASKPTVLAQPSVTGTRKIGKKLASSLASFTSFNGVGLNTFQWYSCSAAVPLNTSSLPAGCVPIAKATKNSFTLTSKQKGKFVTLAISNTNAVGTNRVFTPATAKVK